MEPRRAVFTPAAIVLAIALLFVASSTAVAAQDELAKVEDSPWPKVALDSTDRVLILAPHPDDEVLGCGGVIQQAVAVGLPIRIVFLTYGDFPPIELSGQAVPPPPRVSRESKGLTPVAHEEQAHLVGVVAWTADIEGERLVFSIRLSRPLAREVGCSVYLFGYRGGTPFPQMPKLHLALGEMTQKVFDGGREVAFREIQVCRSGRDIQIRVPLAALRRPQKVLTSAQMHAGPVPLDWTSWRLLEIVDATARGN